MNESVHELMHLRRESRGHVIHLHGRPIEHHMEVMTKGNKSQIDLPYDLNDPPHQVGKYASTKTCVDMHPSHSTRQRFARVTCRVKTTGNNWKQLETTGNNWKQLETTGLPGRGGGMAVLAGEVLPPGKAVPRKGRRSSSAIVQLLSLGWRQNDMKNGPA